MLCGGDGSYEGGGGIERVGDRISRANATGGGGGTPFSCNGKHSGSMEELVGQR
jgi:hypothetical protein